MGVREKIARRLAKDDYVWEVLDTDERNEYLEEADNILSCIAEELPKEETKIDVTNIGVRMSQHGWNKCLAEIREILGENKCITK